MLTKNEITALNLSPTKKDFVQIWNELLEVAGKLSERWDPTSTNESDPGIVILKALTGIADKLNYNIDKNTLEAFMPTAAQEDSMRKLCEMLGYNIKYYRSAETSVTIKYYNPDPSVDENGAMEAPGQLIPKFTVITNADQDINYFTTNPESIYISKLSPMATLPCMEGQIVKCESTADNNVITASQISENNRFYMPESQIAENGIFVYNVDSNMTDGERWEKVDNLNIQARGSRVFKFGYDSYEGRPYLEFPEDYSELINDGLFIYYARTSGVNGNISARTLSQLELPSGGDWSKVSATSFSVENAFSATSGANIETINQAYNNFKKTIGTFETLVTCRDYMNKIYTMIKPGTGKYYVSNSLVTDIRSDLNRAVPICSCDDAGIFYKDTPLIVTKTLTEGTLASLEENSSEIVETFVASTANKPFYRNLARYVPLGDWRKGSYITRFAHWCLGSKDGLSIFNDNYSRDLVEDEAFDARLGGEVSEYKSDGSRSEYWLITQNGTTYETTLPISWVESIEKTQIKTITNTNTEQVITEDAINHFDLVLYPFKSYNQIRGNVKDIQEVYDASFKYDADSFTYVSAELQDSDVKTIAHNIVPPNNNDIISINNYLRLNAIIGTHSKITTEEGTLLIENIKIALANAFNMRELDFGEEIPFDSIVEVIEKADPRIKIVSLAEPALYTTFSVLDRYTNKDKEITYTVREYAVASDWLSDDSADTTGRFEYTDNENKPLHTFNTVEAKKIYNKLAVRNVLAGRVPLFKYNNTFKTSFSEGPYRVTEVIDSVPEGINLTTPDSDNPFTICADGATIYTGQLLDSTTKYTKTYTPDLYTNNIITKDNDNNIIKIEPSCKISSDKDASGSPTYNISQVKLGPGEVVKFRAPNFVTQKTYPAYVNYHLDLNKETLYEAESAKAYTLNSLLNTQTDNRGLTPDERRQRVLDYFNALGHKKTFTLTQTVYKKVNENLEYDSKFITKIENPSSPTFEENPEDILAKCGFVKLINKKAELNWVNNVAEEAPDVFKSDLPLENSLFIADSGVFTGIKNYVDSELERLNNQMPNPLPTTDDWTISYTFEYVPFEPVTLPEWENFIKDNGRLLFGFHPVAENQVILWRSFGSGYSEGKYTLSADTSKLEPFTSGHFGLLKTDRLSDIYVAEDLGNDQKPNYIRNNEEYKLRPGEYLYIEYTPSTTVADGAAEKQGSVTEVFGPGTIIRPNGFSSELGLMDSAVYATRGSSYKTVDFKDKGKLQVYSLGASEQIEIRDESKVVLDKTTLPNTPYIYVYKNFNALELESTNYAKPYTLKDGEYIFYTDNNKSEFAYFTSGTEVSLIGDTTLSKFEKVDLAAIFDNGMQEIPWELGSLNLLDGKGIIFKEFQYITLSEGDTINGLFLAEKLPDKAYLDAQWQKCDNVTYTPAGANEPSNLSKINLSDSSSSGNGWEACSTLELSVSPNSAQTLRKTDKIETSIDLHKENGSAQADLTLEAKTDYPLSFKTNLSCQATSDSLAIADLYSNPSNLKSFEFKVFSEEAPALVKVTKNAKNALIPYRTNTEEYLDILNWPTTQEFIINDFSTLWKPIAFSSFTSTEEYDHALKLPASILPNTYGIFSIYIDYNNEAKGNSADETVNQTWIELLPGVSTDDVMLFNVDISEGGWKAGKLQLKQGINCIRVDKSIDIFIKTSATHGALYFDNIRLVDCQTIEYVENGEKKTQVTQGLNLAQLGYLDTSEEKTFNVFDMHIRKKLKSELTNNALAELDARARKESDAFDSSKKYLVESNTKLQDLVTFINTAKIELEDLKYSGIDIEGLFEKYQEISEDLKQEQELKAALDRNKNINELEQQLAILFESFANADTSRQELFDALDTLEKATIEKAIIFDKNKLSKGDILDDFEAVADISNTPLINDLKLASIKEINAVYSLQLEGLELAIAEIDDSELQEKLRGIINNINAAKHEVLTEQINTLVEANQAALEDSITAAMSYAQGSDEDNDGKVTVNYSALANELISLREQLSNANIKELISQIEFVASGTTANLDKYARLSKLTEELLTLLNSGAGSVPGNYTSLITVVNTVLATVQAKIASSNNAFDNNILTAVSELSSEANKVYVDRIKTILTEMKTVLNALNTEANTAITELNTSNSEAVKAILSNLTSYAEIRDTHIATVTTFSSADYTTLPYGALAVLTVWPAYMKQSFITGVNKLYTDVREAATNPEVATTLVLDKNFYAKDLVKLRSVLVTAADIKAFQSLFDQAKNQVSKNIQNSTRQSLINELGALLQPSDALATAMENLQTDDTANRNAVLCQLIDKLKAAPAVVEKQQLVQALKEELDAVISIDTQLVDASAKLLCPSILIFEKKWPALVEDMFYEELRNFVAEKKNNLVNSFGTTLANLLNELVAIYELLNPLTVSIAKGDITKWEVLETENLEEILSIAPLSTEYISKLKIVKNTVEIQELITTIKNCKLFKFLNKDLVVAWEVIEKITKKDAEGKSTEIEQKFFVDSAGNYFKKYIAVEGKSKWYDYEQYSTNDTLAGGSWTDSDGYWRNSSGEKVNVELRHLVTNKWVDISDSEIIIKTGPAWLAEGSVTEFEIPDEELENLLNKLFEDAAALSTNTISTAFKDTYNIWLLEEQLLKEIRELDRNRDFYYNVPVESNVAIDFNEGNAAANTLMNPAVNYDINNVNNNFVISKIDINYLTNGIQIARSSRLN